jgi:hypothetical protein
MSTLGFEEYVEPLKLYLHKYREARASLLSSLSPRHFAGCELWPLQKHMWLLHNGGIRLHSRIPNLLTVSSKLFEPRVVICVQIQSNAVKRSHDHSVINNTARLYDEFRIEVRRLRKQSWQNRLLPHMKHESRATR